MSRRPIYRVCLAVCLGLCALAAGAQDPPATDIWLFSIEPGDETTEGVPKLAEGANVTDRLGYDNQPFFLADGKALLYTAIVDGQADIYRYDVARGSRHRLTDTAESEYSPTPLADGSGFSVVRVEEDGRQRLWKFDLDGRQPSLLLPDVEPVGYHAWGDDGELVLFVLGEPHALHRARLGVAGSKQVAADIGRALAPIPDQDAVSFIHKAGPGDAEGAAGRGAEGDAEAGWWVKRLHLDSGKIEPLIATLPQREDVAWAPDGTLWGADGGKVYRWCPFCSHRWVLVADLEASHGLQDITRLAIDGQGRRLALVAAVRVAAGSE